MKQEKYKKLMNITAIFVTTIFLVGIVISIIYLKTIFSEERKDPQWLTAANQIKDCWQENSDDFYTKIKEDNYDESREKIEKDIKAMGTNNEKCLADILNKYDHKLWNNEWETNFKKKISESFKLLDHNLTKKIEQLERSTTSEKKINN